MIFGSGIKLQAQDFTPYMEATKDEIILRNELNLTRDSAGDLSLQYWLVCEWNCRAKRYSQLVETSEIGELGDLKKIETKTGLFYSIQSYFINKELDIKCNHLKKV